MGLFGNFLPATRNELKEVIMNLNELKAALETVKKNNAEAFAEIGSKIADQDDRIKKLEEQLQNVELPGDIAQTLAEVVAGSKQLADIVPNPEPEQ